ncbi:MAG: hypothetical protein IPP34_18645 [Bacteroidetes bacterium]|nr:hypothetical protein [Bacteroidota bacterium]
MSGISISGSAASVTQNVYNNLIGDLRAPSVSNTSDAIRGISLLGTYATSNVNVYYNSIYLNASGGANFSTSGVFHTTSATATTANLTLRNNIIYNNSTASGTGTTAAYRRSSTANGNYNAASNRNLFWGGTHLQHN